MKSRFWIYAIIGTLVARFLGATSITRWMHPDEWYQTVEFANLLANGLANNTQEVALHLRNLSWPFLLTLPLSLARWIDPEWIALRTYFVQGFTALLDLGVLWGWTWVARNHFNTLHLKETWLKWSWVLLLFPWFMARDVLRPSQEHLSIIATWICLGLLEKRYYTRAGLAAVGIGAFRYSSGLISLGILISILAHGIHNRRWVKVRNFSIGVFLGFALFGFADWVTYGRPWESLWMYLQYNVLTDLGLKAFGAQSASVYLEFFRGHWGRALLPVALMAVPGVLYGLYLGIRRNKPWAYGALLFVVGHLFIGHKEPRFMAPVEQILLFASIYGWSEFYRRHKKTIQRWYHRKWNANIVRGGVALILLANALLFLRSLWGDTWIANGTYFELGSHLKNRDDVCGVITVRKPISTDLPWLESHSVPFPALAYFPSERRAPSFPQAKERPLIWAERGPTCEESSAILLHVHKPHLGWDSAGCELLPSGVLAWVPKEKWQEVLARNLSSGPWYRCPSSILREFTQTEVRPILARETGLIPNLPPLGIKGEQLLELIQNNVPRPVQAEGTFGDW